MVKVFQGFVKNLSSLYKINTEKGLSAFYLTKVIILMAIFQTVIVESLQRGSVNAALFWIQRNPHLFFLNFCITILISLFFISLTGSLQIVVFLSTFCLVLISLTNFVKIQFLGEPLFPWDLIRVDQVINLLPKYIGEIPIVFIALGLMILGLYFLGRYIVPRCKVRWFFRIALFLSLCIIIPLLIFYRHTPLEAVFKQAKIENLFWIQGQNSLQNGFLLGFTMNLENTMIFEPHGYNTTEIRRIVSETTLKSAGTTQAKKNRPNIVFVLNESFWDPTKISNLTFSKDPLPYFRGLQSQFMSGSMVSPVFGGSTANVEFEILTGLSTKFLPQGAIAYQQYIEKHLPAVPSIFKTDGYETTAIHPYHEWFYKRDKVFKLLGFDKFYSLKDFKDAKVTGEYIGDIEVSKKIVSEIETTNNPAFIFAITMQNHGPYAQSRYKKNEIKVEGNLSAEGKGIIETYVQGVSDADKSLKYLVDNLSRIDEPTIVFFVGDHLPYLGKDYLVYKEAGYITDSEHKWTQEEKIEMKRIPYVIWSNTELKRDVISNKDLISAQYFGNYVLELGHQQPNTIFKFVEKLGNQLPVYNKSLNIDAQNNVLDSLNDEQQKLDEEYWLLEYDLLFGKQYSNLLK